VKVVVAVYALWGVVVLWLILPSTTGDLGSLTGFRVTVALIYASGILLLALFRRSRWPIRATTYLVLGTQALLALGLVVLYAGSRVAG